MFFCKGFERKKYVYVPDTESEWDSAAAGSLDDQLSVEAERASQLRRSEDEGDRAPYIK